MKSTKKKATKKRARTTPEQRAAIEAASGKLYAEDMKTWGARALHFNHAVSGKLGKRETIKAWRDYSELCRRVFESGRLWDSDHVALLAAGLLAIDDEQRELARVQLAFDVAGKSEELAARITSPLASTPPLRVADALINALDLPKKSDREDGRRLAGYLTPDVQTDETAAMKARVKMLDDALGE
jgi:hypothetical protein